LCRSAGFDEDRIRIDPSVVRGLEYYTGPVFEAELTFQVPNERGVPVVFGSVGGGGRYDGLVGRFRAEDVPATGFSIGVSRLAAALKLTGKLGATETQGPVVVTVMDRDKLPEYQRLTVRLREGLNNDTELRKLFGGRPIPVEMYLGSSGMKAQLKYADRRNAPCVVIQGENERQQKPPVVQVKDLALGKEMSRGIKDHETWRAERPAQFEVAEDRLVEEIAALLRRQAGA
jgi:histidyl-tRNA synthetase